MILPDILKTILTQSGFITEADFDAAARASQDVGQAITDILVFRGLISEDALGKLIAEYFKVKFISLKNKVIPIETLQLVPEQAAVTFHIIPFFKDSESIHLGMENPLDIEAIEFVKRKIGVTVVPFYITPADFRKTIGQYKRNIKSLFADIIAENLQKTKMDAANVTEIAEDLPVIKILDTILEYASAEGASDIHFNTLENGLMIRFRVDGMLRDIVNLPKSIQPALVARIKILAVLKIDEHRIPQDGRFKFKIYDDDISLRVSVLPTFFGENVVLRLLPESARPLSLEELGIGAENLPKLRTNIHKPNGLVLSTGPTGSGKTTSLYSVLNMLNTPEVNICTIEDPIEYSVRRINQTQVNQQAGLTFASGLRSLLRHDPDVIMIGEIRDNETAEIAIHAALTGHLVLSTLHTNSAAGAIPRFLDMGAQGFLLASTLNLVIAQRLVRKICTNCIHKVEPTSEMLKLIEEQTGKKSMVTDFFIGKGCRECNGSGYKGRIGVYEILEVTPEIKLLITKNVAESEITAQAIKQGMNTLFMDGLNKVAAGLTTIDEIARVTTD
jgi:type IV pilus assembly protein PilB